MTTGAARAWAVVRVVLVVVLALVLLVPALLPAVTGHRLVVVDGGSMSPTFEVGDVLLTAPPTGDDLHVGRILVVGAEGSVYTHRVVEVDADGARARLRGDANDVADPGWVTQEDVYAVYVSHASGAAATVVRSVTTMPGNLVLLAIAVGLLLIGVRPARPPRHPSPPSP